MRRLLYSNKLLIGLVILCAVTIAVGLASINNPVFAQSYHLEVQAKVNAEPPTSPAVITMPTDGRHFNYPLITVSGTCGDAAYVVIHRNSIETGRAPCSTGTFSLQVQLSVGANQLRATSYNVTDNEGPPSAPITVYYDLLIPDPGLPPHATTELQITSVEGVPYIPGRLYRTSSQPTIQGTAAPFSIVTMTFSPGGAICNVQANAQGQWGCKLTPKLAGGRYQVATSSLSPQNTRSSLAAFSIIVSDLIAPKPPAIIPDGGLHILYIPDGYRTYLPGELWRGRFSIVGGTPPYSLEIDWKDGEVSGYAIADSNEFEVSHTYQKPGIYRQSFMQSIAGAPMPA
jgi:hypothetical protein